MEAAYAEVVKRKEMLRVAEQRLEEEKRKPTVGDLLKQHSYTTVKSALIQVTGPFETFSVEGKEHNLGLADLPMSEFRKAKVMDLSSVLIPHIFAQHIPGDNILERVANYLRYSWAHIREHDMFVLPHDTVGKAQGHTKVDLPNVCFAVTLLMLKNHVEFVVVDPIRKETDATVRIINFSAVLRGLQEKRVRVRTYTDRREINGLRMIVYQRGAGTPKDSEYELMERVTGLDKKGVIHCRLTPGKYEQGLYGGNSGNCYRDFHESVAKLVHQLHIVDPYCTTTGRNTIKEIFFVLDEFSAYAAYTAVCILGYGIQDVATVLAYRRGAYIRMKCQ